MLKEIHCVHNSRFDLTTTVCGKSLTTCKISSFTDKITCKKCKQFALNRERHNAGLATVWHPHGKGPVSWGSR